jgi:hypothetical protein
VASTVRESEKYNMLWLEMSRDDVHGGGSWAFGQSLWSPSRNTNNTKWAFWETLLRVDTDDPVLYLRGKGDSAAFVAFSTAAADGFETSDRPPSPGEWGYARSFYRVPLRDFTPLADPMLLRDVFGGEILSSEVTSRRTKLHPGRNACST